MKNSNNILDEIVAAKKTYLALKKIKAPRNIIDKELLDSMPYSGPGFYEALKHGKPGIKIVAEVKAASPSEGKLREPLDLHEINNIYQESDKVAAISVITEGEYFKGKEEYLVYFAKHNTNHKPILRKDFIFDTYQIVESKLLGAQAFLLIASLFETEELRDLVDFGLSIGIEPLVEVHTPVELRQATATKARCIGVNARDLNTFKIQAKSHLLLKELDESYVRIAESGINTAQNICRISEFADAALIGSHLMKSENIAKTIIGLFKPDKTMAAV